MTNKEIVLTGSTDLLVNLDVSAVDKYWKPDFIQHSQSMPTGSAVFKMMIPNMKQGIKMDVVRMLQDNDLVVMHSRVEGFGPTPIIGFEIFRVEDGKMAEHWTSQTPEVTQTVSGRSQIDGETEIKDLDKTAENKELVQKFFEDILYKHQHNFTDYINPQKYHQHNPLVGDGLEGFGKAMADLKAQGLSMEYKKTYHYIAEGNFVFTFSEGIFAGRHVAFADLFRIENGLIVEHWDAIEDVKPASEAKNTNGVF